MGTWKSHIRHYAWWVVAAALLIYGSGQGILLNTASAFIKPVSESLGISRGAFTAYSGLTTAASVLSIPIYTRLFHSRHLKKAMLLSACVCCLVPFGYGNANALWQFYLLSVLQGLFINGIGTAAVAVIINNWFSDRVGIATGIAYAGSGLIASLMIYIANGIIENLGWQWGYFSIGTAGFLVLLPTIALLLEIHPEDIGQQPYRSNTPLPNKNSNTDAIISIHVSMGKAVFGLLLLATFLDAMLAQAFMANNMANLSDLGYSAAQQSGIASLLMLTLAVAKIIIGWVLDRFGGLSGILVFCVAALTGGLCALCIPMGIGMAYAMAFFIGIGSTGGQVVSSFLTKYYWGSHSFSQIYPIMTVASLAGLALGGPIPGLFYDRFGSYQPAWAVMTVLTVVMTMLELCGWFLVCRCQRKGGTE